MLGEPILEENIMQQNCSNNTISSDLIAIPGYDGYFWNPEDMHVYSLKVTGTLTPLRFNRGTYIKGGSYIEAGFGVSKSGRRRHLKLDWLKKLTPHAYEVPLHRKRWTEGDEA